MATLALHLGGLLLIVGRSFRGIGRSFPWAGPCRGRGDGRILILFRPVLTGRGSRRQRNHAFQHGGEADAPEGGGVHVA